MSPGTAIALGGVVALVPATRANESAMASKRTEVYEADRSPGLSTTSVRGLPPRDH